MKATVDFGGRLAQTIPTSVSCCHTALLVWRSFPFYKGSTHHQSILQQWKQRDKALEGLIKRKSVGRAGKPHLLCLTPFGPRTSPVLGLLWINSHLQCNSWTMFVEAFKYRERKQGCKHIEVKRCSRRVYKSYERHIEYKHFSLFQECRTWSQITLGFAKIHNTDT